MTWAAPGDRICCRCDRPITGGARETVHDSMSGARPSTWAHADPHACRPATRNGKAEAEAEAEAG